MPFNVSFPGRDADGNALANPFAEQLDYFRQKLNLPTERYDDIIQAAHDRAFIVAGAANADLLNDLHQAMQRRIDDGRGLEAFRKEFNAIVLKHGWVGWTGEGTAAGQAWRTRVIYQTNMTTSYAAGRWAQLKSPDLLAVRPYWRYRHNDGVMHPRPLHVSWDGLVLHHDHPFWLTHFPPNGWGCQCWVVAVDAKEYAKADAAGRAEPPAGWDTPDPETNAPPGIDKGWNYAPGANAKTPLQDLLDQKLINLNAPAGAAMNKALQPALKEERQRKLAAFRADVAADPAPRGRMIAVGAIDPAAYLWLDRTAGTVPAGAAITLQDGVLAGLQGPGAALDAGDWTRLVDSLAAPERVLWDASRSKLLYVVDAGAGRGRLVIEVEARSGTQGNLVTGGIRVSEETIEAQIRAGAYQIVK